MIDETIRCLKAHFSCPLKRIKPEDEEKLMGLVHFPLKNPTKPGGFTKAGEKWVQANKLAELESLAETHKETVRIQIHAVLKTAGLFLKSKREKLEDKEREVLFKGIVLESPLNTIQTVKKAGSILTSEFEQNMTELYKGLSKNNPESLSCKQLLLEVANEQKIAKERDQNLGTSLLNI